MAKKTKVEPKGQPKSQSELFIDRAREIGADHDEDVSEVMRNLASRPPQPHKKAPKK